MAIASPETHPSSIPSRFGPANLGLIFETSYESLFVVLDPSNEFDNDNRFFGHDFHSPVVCTEIARNSGHSP